MTDIPDAAVQIVTEALSSFTDDDQALARVAVGVLERADMLCPPGTQSRLAALEADLLKIEGFRADLAARCFRQAVELDELRSTAALPTEGRDPPRAQGEDVERYGEFCYDHNEEYQDHDCDAAPQPAGDDEGRA